MAKETISKAGDEQAAEADQAEEVATETQSKEVDEPSAEPEQAEEQQAKQAFLKRFRKSNPGKKQEKSQDFDTERPVSSDELAKKLYQDIAETKSHDYILIRIRKRTVLVIAGLLVVLMWLLSILNRLGGFDRLLGDRLTGSPVQNEPVDQALSVSPSPVQADERVNNPEMVIRIRSNSEGEATLSLQNFLLAKGYRNVEVDPDPDGDFTGVQVVVKPEEAGLKHELETILSDEYQVSSPSAELTEDSDVDVVVLFGR